VKLQQGIIYGPVSSRRLGRSLGINLLPIHRKVCTLDCVYCQYGWTEKGSPDDSPAFPPVEAVAAAVHRALETCSPHPAYITFSGNGEATLHPQFPLIVQEVVSLRNRLAPSARTAILSNATASGRESVRRALALLDERILKLDVGNDKCLQRYNRPGSRITFERLVSNIQAVGDVTIQTLFTRGVAGNYVPQHVEEWINTIVRIQPVTVQLYTLSRSYPSRDIEPVTREDLLTIKKRLAAAGVSSEVY
jgi:wyosine [tRNA(Phe)-imidazoG37] synthetase (radical SAM superfamily)